MPSSKLERDIQISEIAFELQSWCKSVLDLMDKGLFGITQDISHYDAMLLGLNAPITPPTRGRAR